MSPGRWEKVKAIFSSAIEVEPGSREAYVRNAAAGDRAVIDEVLSLLRTDSEQSLRNPLFTSVSAALALGGRADAAAAEDRYLQQAAGIEGALPKSTQSSEGSGTWRVDWFGERIGSYRVLECIGQGGMGVVYRAHDEYLHRFVALKTLQRTAAATLHRFKQEFRSFADMVHPNLVSLYELLSDGNRWCFTMELVEGRPFLDRFADEIASGSNSSGSNAAVRLDRIRVAFRQLAGGVAALHAADKLHRDLKPSNVLVTAEDRVVILDFGLGAELDLIGLHQSTDGHVMGSVAYMSPEQAAGGPISAFSDWYSVGVMLYQALTGRLPFEGSLLDVLRAKESRSPEPPADVAPLIPDDLNALCAALLSRNPADRPDGPAILAHFGARHERVTSMGFSASPSRDAPFVGRSEELAALGDAFQTMRRGHPVIVYVQGYSGAGKTALVHRFLDEVSQDPKTVVLTGGCHEHELVPFKALDNLIDSLVQYLRRLGPVELNAVMPRDIRTLAQVFPAFSRIPAVQDAPTVGSAEMSPPELRRRAAVALRELLARLGDRRKLFLFIDDLHWGDIDSAALLTDILTPPDQPVFLGICCYRSEDRAGSAFFDYMQEFRRRAPPMYDERHIALGQLSPTETSELTRRLMDSSPEVTEAVIEEIARESTGRPFLIYELIEHVRASKEGQVFRKSMTLNEVLWQRIEALPEASRRLLEIVAISGRPIDIVNACQAAGVAADDRVVLQPLKAGRLIRGTPIARGYRIEVYHDRVRQLVLDRLPAEVLEDRHRQFAKALSESDHADAEVMAYHLHRGGLPEDAAEYYAQSASAAAHALAFEHAAVLYQHALDLKVWTADQQRDLRARRGDALSNAGRGADAAREYLAASIDASSAAAFDLQHRAALALLTSGHVDEGLSRLAPVLQSVGTRLAGAPWRALCSLVFRRLQLRIRGVGFAERQEESIGPKELRCIDVGWSVVIGLSIIDPIRGADFQTRNLLMALRAGEPFRVARALAVEASHLASSGDVAQAKKILSEAERLAARLQRPYANGMVELARGAVAYFDGKWCSALESCRTAAAAFREHCPGTTWEIDTANAFSLWSLAKTGEIGELSRVCPALLKEARERGDLYAIANLSTQIMALVRLAEDDAERARDELCEVMKSWSQNGYHVQHHDALLAFVPIELYCGNPSAAWDRVQAEWAAFRWSLLSHIQDLRIEMLQLRSYCALAMAVTAKDRSRFLAAAARDSRRLRKEKLPWTSALADYIAGTIAYLEGDLVAARARLSAAAAAFDGVHAHLHAAVTRRRLAGIAGCDDASELRYRSDEWFRQQGIKVPERMLDAYAPGFRN